MACTSLEDVSHAFFAALKRLVWLVGRLTGVSRHGKISQKFHF
jgi:hypothetical protein